MSGKELGFQLNDIEARFALIQQKVGEFPAVLEQLDTVVADFDGTTDEGLAAMAPKELDAQRSALNKQIKAVRDLRAAIGKAYDEPKKALYAAVDERLADADAILARCDTVREMNKHAKLAERKAGLESYYAEVAGVLADYVAFDAIYDPDWVKSDAKYKAAFDTICDKCKCIENLLCCVKSVAELKTFIDSLFTEENVKNAVTFSTVHKSKGLEADKVVVLLPHKLPLVWKGQKAWQYQQERNLQYVAYTRAKKVLTFVNLEEADLIAANVEND